MATWLETLTAALGEPVEVDEENGRRIWLVDGHRVTIELTLWASFGTYSLHIDNGGTSLRMNLPPKVISDGHLIAACRLAGVLPERYEYGCQVGDEVYPQASHGMANLTVASNAAGAQVARRPVGPWESCPESQPTQEATP